MRESEKIISDNFPIIEYKILSISQEKETTSTRVKTFCINNFNIYFFKNIHWNIYYREIYIYYIYKHMLNIYCIRWKLDYGECIASMTHAGKRHDSWHACHALSLPRPRVRTGPQQTRVTNSCENFDPRKSVSCNENTTRSEIVQEISS